MLGTTNMDNRSFEHNDEVNVAMRDAAVAARLLEDYARDLARQRRDHARTLAPPPAVGKNRRSVHLDSGASAVSEPQRAARRHVDLRIATYNIHRCRGMDRRVVAVADRRSDSRASTPTSSRCRKSIGAGPIGAGQAEEIGAALGMGWVMAPVRHLRQSPLRQRDPEPLPDRASQPVRLVVAHVRSSAPASAPTSTWRRPTAAHLQRAPRHRGARAPLSGTAAGRVRPRPPRRGARRSSSATSTSGCAASRRRR